MTTNKNEIMSGCGGSVEDGWSFDKASSIVFCQSQENYNKNRMVLIRNPAFNVF